MNGPMIVLSADHIAQLRLPEGRIWVRDTNDVPVRLFTSDGLAGSLSSAPEVRLSAADLDLIESQPEGLVVADTARTTGWTIRKVAS